MDENLLLLTDQFREEKGFWLETLSGDVKETFLVNYVHPIMGDSMIQGTMDFAFPLQLSAELIRISKQSDRSLYLLLLAAVNVLIYRYTGNEDLFIGAPLYRDDGAAAKTNDFVILRNPCSAEMTVKECLQAVRETTREAYNACHYPLNRILEQILRPESGNEFVNLCHVALLLTNIHAESPTLSAKSEVILAITRNDTILQGTVTFHHRRYSQRWMDQWIQHYIYILEQMVENIQILVAKVRLLAQEERARVVYEFNKTKRDVVQDKTVHQLFEKVVERTPDAVALLDRHTTMTYRQLNAKANQLARFLRKRGVGPDVIVALHMERSMEMMMSIFAILKAGGAYLPIDPLTPPDRLVYILQESQSSIMMMQNHSKPVEGYQGEILTLAEADWATEGTENLEHTNSPRDLAYVIYTSGSTGRPKGVMVEHRSLINNIQDLQMNYPMTPNHRQLFSSSYFFDPSIQEYMWPLLSGAQCVLMEPDGEKFPKKVIETIRTFAITHVIMAPVLLNETMLALQEMGSPGLPSLQHVFAGGEALPGPMANRFLQTFPPSTILMNRYGPTEATIDCISYSVLTHVQTAITPLGRPLANMQIYILDEQCEPVPIGVAGEIYISGIGVSRGYIQRPDLTAERFIPNPFLPGERMYKTGDLGRWTWDGVIEYLGRNDFQIKIRGMRIELGEIEKRILEHPAVKEAVVHPGEDAVTGTYICAYYVTDQAVSAADLRAGLAKTLPSYMVPAYLIPLERLPLSANGKIDRKALPRPTGELMQALRGSHLRMPENAVEAKLVEIWKDLFRRDQISTDDNFYELGGHSLMATILIARILQEFQVEMSLRDLYKYPTIQRIAEWVHRAERVAYRTIEPAPEMEFYPLTSAQKRIYIMSQFSPTSVHYNMPGVMVIEGELDRERFERAFAEMIQRHTILRTSFTVVDDQPMQQVHSQVPFSIEDWDLNGTRVETRIQKFIRPFDLSEAPLLRVGLAPLGEGNHLFLVDMHHIIADGMSIAMFIREWIQHYDGKCLPPLKIQYKDFAVWQNQFSMSETALKQEEYWLSHLSGDLPVLNLLTDYPRPSVQNYAGALKRYILTSEQVEQLQQVIRETESTMFIVLLAVFNVLLARYTGQEDILIGSPIAGRHHADLEMVMGNCINTLVMRNRPSGIKPFREFLLEVRENAFKAYEHQDYPFENLATRLESRRDLSRSSLFDVLFSMQNMQNETMATEELRCWPYEFAYTVAKFDLSIYASDTPSQVILDFEYATALFKEETMERMIQHYGEILDTICHNPDIPIQEIEMSQRYLALENVLEDDVEFTF